jgi:lipopolysaccharide/colanic/teichoic acid biosynthesis glycosyltransferase
MTTATLGARSGNSQAAHPNARTFEVTNVNLRSPAKHTAPKQAVASLALKWLDANLPVVTAGGNLSQSYRTIKRVMDIAGALVALVILGPVMLAALVALTITTKGKPLYSQERAGYLGQRFRMWKFRTMRLDADKIKHTVANEADGPVFKNRRDPRITRLGRWLRKLSIDEMPQLVNVLRGEMSLVGPRPLVLPEVAKFEPWQRGRMSVRPGLTCLWQVSGRSEIGFTDWARLDLWYVQNQSLWTDLVLLVRTPLSVLSGRGAY